MVSITCQRDELQQALSVATRAMSSRSTISILDGICIWGREDALEIICTDLQMCIRKEIEAVCSQEFQAILPGRLFPEIIRRLPEGDIHMAIDEKLTVTITSGGSRTTLQALDAADYPVMPLLSDEHLVHVREKDLRDMLRQSLFAAAQDDARPILTGALLEVDGHNMSIVTIDGYRLALRKIALEEAAMAREAVAPARTLLEIARILGDGKESVALHIQDNHMMAEFDRTYVTMRLMEGEFIKYRQILPSEAATKVEVSVEALLSAIERASLMARDNKSNLVRVQVEEEQLVITSNSQIGEAYEEVACRMSGKPLAIAFNAHYMLDVLRVLEEETVQLQLNTNVSPCVFSPLEGDGFLYLVLPVRTYGG
ncbi:MAG: DNA polymerase III subunit beta [Christensenellales bacterium]|jgi:DNA polymerase-3 subunit beta